MSAPEVPANAPQDDLRQTMRRRNLRTAIILFVVVAGFIVSVFYKYGAFN